MNTHDFIHKIFILSFISVVQSEIITFLNACLQTSVLVLIETYILVYKKKTSFPHHTVHLQKYCEQKLLLTAL